MLAMTPGAVRPTAPGVYLTELPTGQFLFRRYDGCAWHYGDPYRGNTEGFRKRLPAAMSRELVSGWAPSDARRAPRTRSEHSSIATRGTAP